MRSNYLRPSELLKMQRETGKSYWDLIGRPLYDEGKDDTTREEAEALRYSLGVKLDNMPQIYDPLPMYKGGKDDDLYRYRTSEDFITEYEGFRPDAYQVKGDVPTIGYGTTDPKWVRKGRITEEEARLALREYVDKGNETIRKYVKNYDDLPASARIVLDDIYYNIGPGNLAKSKKFLAAVNRSDWRDAVKQMDWDNNKPGFSKGARRRNDARAKLWMRDLSNTPEPSKPIPVPLTNFERPIPFDYQEYKTDRTEFPIQTAFASPSSWNKVESPAPTARVPYSITQLMDQYIPRGGVTLDKPIWRVD